MSDRRPGLAGNRPCAERSGLRQLARQAREQGRAARKGPALSRGRTCEGTTSTAPRSPPLPTSEERAGGGGAGARRPKRGLQGTIAAREKGGLTPHGPPRRPRGACADPRVRKEFRLVETTASRCSRHAPPAPGSPPPCVSGSEGWADRSGSLPLPSGPGIPWGLGSFPEHIFFKFHPGASEGQHFLSS